MEALLTGALTAPSWTPTGYKCPYRQYGHSKLHLLQHLGAEGYCD